MTAVISYSSNVPILDLSPLTTFSDVTYNVSPLFYQLQHEDFHAFANNNREAYYCLDQGTGIALWWTLKRLYREIMRAAMAQLPQGEDLPLTLSAPYQIPDYLFREIDLAPPAILDMGYVDSINALYMYAPKETIQAFWSDFQDVGRQAVQWIEIAQFRSNFLGQDSRWDWDTTSQAQLDFPRRRMITYPAERGQNDNISLITQAHSSLLATYPRRPPKQRTTGTVNSTWTHLPTTVPT
ncbi:hypothetical protein M413DRAFT_75939 [Hebeloma cylindrosporum]|uniref:Uncharacterized protein n=1 Tax=Hebeloma cylindrosporum TaxID=76867 RepID=A0A0C3BPH0_HEBCY|nr:hypothetical protein M413DRAFT_75939 [Hebeloma cylindrosporum h7]